MSDAPSKEQLIRDMAMLSITSGRISSIQEKNLKMFPLIFFNNVKQVKIDYDFSNTALVDYEQDNKEVQIKYNFQKIDTSHFKINYYIDFENDEKQDNLDKRFTALEESVKGLFWKNMKVNVYFGNELVYESKRDVRKQATK